MSNYLITGVAGFIAARVAEMLLDDGHTVVGLDNMNQAYDVRVKQYRLDQLLGRDGFNFHQLDISDREFLQTTASLNLPAFDGVINLAARAGVRASVEDPWVYVDTNMTGTLNLLEYCVRNDIPKFILASTSSIYGGDAPLPTPESASSDRPLQAYAASKKGAEAMAHAYHYLYDLDVTVVRYFTVYGPAGRPDMVMFRFVQWITEGVPLHLNGDGSQSRGFTYVDDIARGTLLALKPVGYEIINLGGHEVITINELIAILEEMTGKKATIEYHPQHPADAMGNHAVVTKAGEVLGWEAQVSLQEGVRNLVDWYNQNRQWAKDIETI
jgi:UDP-glucuronate 4-epimerase